MCVKRRKAEALAKCKFRNMTVGNFSYEFKPLRLGQLAGNRFKLAIRYYYPFKNIKLIILMSYWVISLKSVSEFFSQNSFCCLRINGCIFGSSFRDVKVDDEVIDKIMNSLREAGFINYFGLQRFGSSAIVPTYAVGKAILLSDWQKVRKKIVLVNKR
jgi:tRNA(Glu) U13 pseudouridine synthase TruD